jgi:hypothetical protein
LPVGRKSVHGSDRSAPATGPNFATQASKNGGRIWLECGTGLNNPYPEAASKTQAIIGKFRIPQCKIFGFVVDIKSRSTLYTAFGTPPAKARTLARWRATEAPHWNSETASDGYRVRGVSTLFGPPERGSLGPGLFEN